MSGIEISTPCPHWQSLHEAILETAALATQTVLADQGLGPDADADMAGDAGYEISIVLADDAFVRDLNRQYRNIDRPTNVLSFPSGDEDGHGPVLLGDVVLAYETVAREAQAAGKSLSAHVTHLIIHGILHLLGYDHEDEQEAEEMEALETALLARLGITDPYVAVMEGP